MSPLRDPDERKRVARVEVVLGTEKREYLDHFITVDPDTHTVTVWESKDSGQPLATAPLESTLLEWVIPGEERSST